MEIYIRIREEIKKLGVTQKRISEILEITQPTLAKYLNRNEKDRREVPHHEYKGKSGDKKSKD